MCTMYVPRYQSTDSHPQPPLAPPTASLLSVISGSACGCAVSPPIRNKPITLLSSRHLTAPAVGALSLGECGLVPAWSGSIGVGSPGPLCTSSPGPGPALLPPRASHSHSQTEDPHFSPAPPSGAQNRSTGLAKGQNPFIPLFLISLFLSAPRNSFLSRQCQCEPKALLKIGSCRQAPAGVANLPGLQLAEVWCELPRKEPWA